MANPYPASFEDDQGNTRLEGQIDFTDPANQPGGSQPAVSDGTTSIAAASSFVFPGGTLSEPSPGVASIDHLVQAATVTLTSADILALHSQVTLVPSPGTGKVLVPISAMAVMHVGATPYATWDVVQVGWPVFPNVLALNILGASGQDAFYVNDAVTDQENLADVEDAPLVAGAPLNPTDGDGTCDVTVCYLVLSV